MSRIVSGNGRAYMLGAGRAPDGSEAKRLARIERGLGRVLDLLDPTSPCSALLDPWRDERAYIYTGREAVRRIRARLNDLCPPAQQGLERNGTPDNAGDDERADSTTLYS